MIKSILKFKGAQELTISEQKSINGGIDKTCFLQCGPAGGVPDRNNPGVCICY